MSKIHGTHLYSVSFVRHSKIRRRKFVNRAKSQDPTELKTKSNNEGIVVARNSFSVIPA
ncbi:hypothetical protein AWH56_019820 [Anaerobacillus isosaccharinicus]|uniref:Uncharacterized protein n=1 Tax=Anaerobacillus isosaccharinicus TaxID=1532552 RepID=A0A7S7RAJ3_9BACI|nr:hypothetical protein [Anaerobacillus isosaccharinicus]QOY34941.1 hypothetical protein AWH56_019820 [Anaerobacillus isosaccharinicus]